MNALRSTGRHQLACVVMATLLVLMGPAATGARANRTTASSRDAAGSQRDVTNHPLVLPPNAKAFGKTYGELSAEWWKWALALPADDDHPLIADGDMDCTLGQQGKVWFLGGTYAAVPDPGDSNVVRGTADRRCAIPTGKALYFPIINIICSEVTGDGSTGAELTGCATSLLDEFVRTDTLSATVDGRRITRLRPYRTVSDPFTIDPLPVPNLLGAPLCLATEGCPPGQVGPTTGPAVTSGYYLLLAPLSKGEHTLTFEGKLVAGDFEFALDIRYALTVVGGR